MMNVFDTDSLEGIVQIFDDANKKGIQPIAAYSSVPK